MTSSSPTSLHQGDNNNGNNINTNNKENEGHHRRRSDQPNDSNRCDVKEGGKNYDTYDDRRRDSTYISSSKEHGGWKRDHHHHHHYDDKEHYKNNNNNRNDKDDGHRYDTARGSSFSSTRHDRQRSRSRSPHHHHHDRHREPSDRDYDYHHDDSYGGRRNHQCGRDHHHPRHSHRDDRVHENRDYSNRRRHDDDDHRRERYHHRDRHQEGEDSRRRLHHPPPPPRDSEQEETMKVVMLKDEKLGQLQDDPRGDDPTRRITHKANSRGNGRNTESFNPSSTLVRPDLRIHVGSNTIPKYDKPLKHDDVLIVPELFGREDDWTTYYQLVQELRDIQATKTVKGSEWISWHEGAHLICKNPSISPTFQKIIDRLCEYFHIKKESIGTRFNWYKDSSDWKPFHHDSAAFNPQRAKTQNITVGVSFGATRELAFLRATTKNNNDHDNEQNNNSNDNKVRLYFPQCNNGVFSFGRDANILWKHGINALAPQEQDGKGRISIILWGLAQNVIEEYGSPPLLGSDGHGPHASHRRQGDNNHNRHHHHHRDGRHHHGR